MVLRAKMVAQSFTVDWLSNAPCVPSHLTNNETVVTCRPMARIARVRPVLIVTATSATAQSQLHEYTTSTHLARNVQHTTYKMLALSGRPLTAPVTQWAGWLLSICLGRTTTETTRWPSSPQTILSLLCCSRWPCQVMMVLHPSFSSLMMPLLHCQLSPLRCTPMVDELFL